MTTSRWVQVSPEEFLEARNQSTRLGFLTPCEPLDLKEHLLMVSRDRRVGFAISPQGDLQSVFNNGGPRGADADAVREAVALGARTCDIYDGFLRGFYGRFGFVEVSRVPFDPTLAPATWDYTTYGTPDVVFMRRD